MKPWMQRGRSPSLAWGSCRYVLTSLAPKRQVHANRSRYQDVPKVCPTLGYSTSAAVLPLLRLFPELDHYPSISTTMGLAEYRRHKADWCVTSQPFHLPWTRHQCDHPLIFAKPAQTVRTGL